MPIDDKFENAPKYVGATKTGVYAKESRACLRALVDYLFSKRGVPLTGITYQDLAARIGRLNKHGVGHGHGMGMMLGVMGHLLEELDGDWGEGVPKIQCLVVNKSGPARGLPDIGIKEFWPGYGRMSYSERRQHVLGEYERIAEFGSRWNQILVAVGLTPIVDTTPSPSPSRGGGESPQHRRLQEHVRDHPELVGLDHTWTCDENYTLPSQDEIDLLFRSAGSCLAVEVKSSVSDALLEDYERGIYQAIKYSSLLTAMHTAGRSESRPYVASVLVLESRLPAQYRQLAARLNVRVIEGIKVPDTD